MKNKSVKMGKVSRRAPGAGMAIGKVKPAAHAAGAQNPRPATGTRKSPAQMKQS